MSYFKLVNTCSPSGTDRKSIVFTAGRLERTLGGLDSLEFFSTTTNSLNETVWERVNQTNGGIMLKSIEFTHCGCANKTNELKLDIMKDHLYQIWPFHCVHLSIISTAKILQNSAFGNVL